MIVLRTLRLPVGDWRIQEFYRDHQGARYRRKSDLSAGFDYKRHLLNEQPGKTICSCGVALEIDRSQDEGE